MFNDIVINLAHIQETEKSNHVLELLGQTSYFLVSANELIQFYIRILCMYARHLKEKFRHCDAVTSVTDGGTSHSIQPTFSNKTWVLGNI